MVFNFEPEIVDFPTSDYPNYDGKAIQLYVSNSPNTVPDIPILVFGSGIHGLVLQKYLDAHGLEYETVKGAYTQKTVPIPEGKQYSVVGIAGVRVMPKMNMIMLIPGSMDYSTLETNSTHLEQIISYGIVPQSWEILA